MSHHRSLTRRDMLAAAALLPTCAFADDLPNVDQQLRKDAKAASLSLQFRGKTKADAKAWQKNFAKVLRAALGPHKPPQDWSVKVEEDRQLPKYRRRQLLLSAKGVPTLPIYVLTPHGIKQPRPGVLALHGHGTYGSDTVVGRKGIAGIAQAIRGANYDYAHQLAEEGYVVVAPCMTPFGRRLHANVKLRKRTGSDPCAVTFVRMALLGRILMSENLRDCLWAFEYLARMKSTDVNRLGCVGLSYGGRMTMLTSALEPRISLAVISGALNVMQERVQHRYSCGAQVIPGLLKFGDVPEIGSLIAPRHCVWEVGDKDGLITKSWADQAKKKINRVYSALGASGAIHYDQFHGGHRWSGKVAYPLMRKVWS